MAHGYAQQKFFAALFPLVTGNEPVRVRLALAADALIGLELEELPEGMRDDFQQLRRDLMQTPLRWPNSPYFRRRNVTPRDARRLSQKMLEMYTELLGGLA